MVLDALLAERVQAVEALGRLEALQADLAGEELLVDLLRELVARHRGGHVVADAAQVDGLGEVALALLAAPVPATQGQRGIR